MQGVIYVKIRILLNQDVDEETVKEAVQQMDYSITDTTGKLSICETELVDFE